MLFYLVYTIPDQYRLDVKLLAFSLVSGVTGSGQN
jgi:hypothetical protein